MGWDGILISEPHKTTAEKIECFKKYYNYDFEKVSIKNGVLYGAVKGVDRLTNESIVWALVAIIKFSTRNFQTEMCCKLMDETEHPYYYDCPKSILDLLSNTDNEQALEWRAKCRERLDMAKTVKGVKTDFVYFPNGLDFTYSKGLHFFEKIKYRRYYHAFESETYTYSSKSIKNGIDTQEYRFIDENTYIKCRDLYIKVREAKKQLDMIRIGMTYYNLDLDMVLKDRKITNEKYTEYLRLKDLDLIEEYNKIINS